MEHTTSEAPQKTFTCQLCGLSSPFTYYGQKPPNTRAIVLLEECFVTRDPFSPDREKFLVLGSSCSLCSVCVCAGSAQCTSVGMLPPGGTNDSSPDKECDCSLFYTKRFCMQCVNKHLDQFPQQIQAELAKKKQSSKSAVS
ncbi:cysteine-rich DPF motif domain-containing protein 1 isoform X1 [Dicentrarchus labrax]|uniref:Cysteine-rich DPF motif domain-containing protein 1 n=1 Tax=Dicentrarchus labrax TaxID=13489 RepID=A0A8P4KT09_DICLA|nr:cysteine-rich DPF motif domain-containing protein 1 isoform X1 [Dicentrarchus labrax]